MRFTEIDGQKYEVKACEECPFRDMGDDGWSAHCTYPGVSQGKDHIEIAYDGKIAKGCPLREVKEHKPCPFCGSTNLNELYSNDEGEPLEEWMMEKANKYGGDYGSWDEYVDVNAYLYYVECKDCHGNVFSKDGREDVWDKWDRRA